MKKIVTVHLLLLSFVFVPEVLAGPKSGGGVSGSGGRSYSAGGGSKSVSIGGGGKSYSAGKSSVVVPKGISGTKTYSSGSPGSPVIVSSTVKPAKLTFDRAAIKDAQTAESKVAYLKTFSKGETPKPTYKASDGKEIKIDPADKKVESVRRNMDHQKWIERDVRQEQYFEPYKSRPTIWTPGVHYSDPFNDHFFIWLMAQSLDTRSMYMYNYKTQMDKARYDYLLDKDPIMAARVWQIEQNKLDRDSTYTPPGIDHDLMYTNDYVDAVYNPTDANHHETYTSTLDVGGGVSTGWIIFWVIVILLILIILGVITEGEIFVLLAIVLEGVAACL